MLFSSLSLPTVSINPFDISLAHFKCPCNTNIDYIIDENNVIEEYSLSPATNQGINQPKKKVTPEKLSFAFNIKKSDILNAIVGTRNLFNTDFIRSKSIDLGSGASIRNKVSQNILPLKGVLKKAIQSISPSKRLDSKRLEVNIDTDRLNNTCNKLDIRSLDLAHVEIYPHHRNNLLSTSERHSKTVCESQRDHISYYKTPKIVLVTNKSSLKNTNEQTVTKSPSTTGPSPCEVRDYTYHIVDNPDSLSHPTDIARTKATYPTESHCRTQSVSHCLDMTRLSPPSVEPGPSRRYRHSISGQTGYFRMNSYGLMFHGAKRVSSANSLFSTAVISGSSSAPNLRDMIPNSASVTGDDKYIYFLTLPEILAFQNCSTFVTLYLPMY